MDDRDRTDRSASEEKDERRRRTFICPHCEDDAEFATRDELREHIFSDHVEEK